MRFAIAKFRVEYNYKIVSIINILSSLLGVILSIYLVRKIFMANAYYGKILGSGLLVIVIGIIYLVFFLIKGKTLINKNYWKYALVLSIPFILHNISGVINSHFDRIIINNYFGSSQAGIYSFGYSFATIIGVIIASFGQAFGPYALDKMEKNQIEKIKYVSKAYKIFFILFYSLFLLVTPEFVKILAPQDYWDGISVIPFIFMGNFFIFMNSFEVYSQYYLKKTKYKAAGTLIAALVNIVLNLIFVPKFGYIAAAITTSISYLLIVIYNFYINRNILKYSMYGGKFHLESIFQLLIITALYFLFVNNLLIRVVIIITISLYSLITITRYLKIKV
jgi:O-antigen/teichoic acid export membrane protein